MLTLAALAANGVTGIGVADFDIFYFAWVTEVSDNSPMILKLLFIAAFLADLFLNARAYIAYNMMLSSHERSAESGVIADHALPITLALIFSILIAIILAGVVL